MLRMQYVVMLPHSDSLLPISPPPICFAATLPGSAQSRAAVTVEDYQRAEKFMNYNTTPLVSNGPVRATWLPGDRFWYRNHERDRQRVLPRRRGQGHARRPRSITPPSPTALTTAMGKPVSAAQLPFQQITFAADSTSFSFDSD